MERNMIVKKGTVILLLFLSSSFAIADTLPEDPIRGKQLFVNKGCVKCHDMTAEGSRIGPDFVKEDLGDTPLDLAAKFWNHTPSMVLGMEGTRMIKPVLTGQEFNDLSVYLYFLRFSDGRGNPVRGRSVIIFRNEMCRMSWARPDARQTAIHRPFQISGHIQNRPRRPYLESQLRNHEC